MKDEAIFIYGKHAVMEALTMRPDVVRVVHLVEGDERNEIHEILSRTAIPKKNFTAQKPPVGVPIDAVHQGFVAEIAPGKLVCTYEDFMSSHTVTNESAFAILGEVQDPHNVGAVIRSAAALGISAVFIPEHRQAPLNGTVIKVSVGTAFRIPLVRIGNVNQIIHELKQRGFWIYGLAGDATQSVTDELFEKPTAIILGNEADGIRRKTLEHCDIPLRIPMSPHVESLNVSVAASIVFYAWSMRHPQKLQ